MEKEEEEKEKGQKEKEGTHRNETSIFFSILFLILKHYVR